MDYTGAVQLPARDTYNNLTFSGGNTKLLSNLDLTINGAHLISDVLRLCGAENVFVNVPMLVTAISEEALVKAQPQILLGMASTKNQEIETLQMWRTLPLRAVRQKKIGFVHPDLISRATPRILLGAAQMCADIDAARQP